MSWYQVPPHPPIWDWPRGWCGDEGVMKKPDENPEQALLWPLMLGKTSMHLCPPAQKIIFIHGECTHPLHPYWFLFKGQIILGININQQDQRGRGLFLFEKRIQNAMDQPAEWGPKHAHRWGQRDGLEGPGRQAQRHYTSESGGRGGHGMMLAWNVIP